MYSERCAIYTPLQCLEGEGSFSATDEISRGISCCSLQKKKNYDGKQSLEGQY